jgi:hypothetical protein
MIILLLFFCSGATALGFRQYLVRGLQLKPDSEVLRYLGRILVRNGILQPQELQVIETGP